MKERFNTQIEKELPEALRNVVRQHPLKKIFQEEEARIRQSASSGNQPPIVSASGGARVVSMGRRLAAVAAVLLVVGFSGYFVWQEFFVEPPLAVELMVMPESEEKASQELEAVFLKASDAFFNQDFKKAVQLFAAIPKTSKWYNKSQFLLAHAHHHLTNYKEAIRIYNYFLTNKEAFSSLPMIQQDIPTLRWNLALAYWGDQNKGMAQQELDRFKQEIGSNPNWNNKIELFEAELKK
ncbi:MAG: tetratricopeptide repeat protein [Saprospiraceae bacterium]